MGCRLAKLLGEGTGSLVDDGLLIAIYRIADINLNNRNYQNIAGYREGRWFPTAPTPILFRNRLSGFSG